MNKSVYALTIVVLFSMSSAVRAIPNQYTLPGFTGLNGSVLNGSITVDDMDMDARIFANEITAWSFTSNLGVGFSFGSGDVGSEIFVGACLVGCFSVNGSSLILDVSTIENPRTNFWFTTGNNTVVFSESEGGLSPPNLAEIHWSNFNDTGNAFDVAQVGRHGDAGIQGIVASASTSPMPEPSSLALLGIALAACFGVAGTRSGKQKSTV